MAADSSDFRRWLALIKKKKKFKRTTVRETEEEADADLKSQSRFS